MTVEETTDTWLSRKLAAEGRTADCRFPDCTAEPERPRPGKTGPPPAFCADHNNAADRQRAYRIEKAEAKRRTEQQEAEAAEQDTDTPREPLVRVMARRAREQAVLAELLPRTLAALTAIQDGERAAADADAVADHIAQVERAADERVRDADAARSLADSQAATARTGLQWALLCLTAGLADRDAAYAEAATALREAADADARATADRAALDELEGRHQELTGEHQALTGRHERLTGEHQALGERHRELTERTGRLEGELAVLKPQLEQLAAENTGLQESLRQAVGELATAHARAREFATRADDLTALVDARDEQIAAERKAHREELAATTAEAARTLADSTTREGDLRQQLGTERAEREAERREHQRVLAELRTQIQEQQDRPATP